MGSPSRPRALSHLRTLFRSTWQNGQVPYFADQMFFGVPGDLNPWDVRFDPADAASLSIEADGRTRFRLVTEPAFRRAFVVTGDGVGHELSLLFGERSIQIWEATLDLADGIGYTFALETDDGRPVYRLPAGIGNAVERLDRWTLDPSTIRRTATPGWSRGMVMYQIFPERFYNGDPSLDPDGATPWGSEPGWLDFQGGDLIGIAEKVAHLERLGVDCVYLNPIFTSPSTHRYDAIDYYTVDPALGGNDSLRALVDALHRRDIRLIIDTSFNHCHPRFFAFADIVDNGAASPYADWFTVTDWPARVIFRPDRLAAEGYRDPRRYRDYMERFAATSGVPVEIADDDGPAVNLTYEAWYGVPSLPRIDLANPDARSYFLDVARHWIDEYGIDGWRMDVARYVDFGFWREFREAVKAVEPDAYLIAEIMGDASKWLQGDTFDATMNYTFRQLIIDFAAKRTGTGHDLADGLARMYATYSPDVVASSQNLLGSHDTARFLHEAGGDVSRLRLATAAQLTLPGAPGLYYGDEVGMTGGEEPASRGAFPWHDPNAWDTDQLHLVRSLTALRRGHPSLRNGTMDIVGRWRDGIAFVRTLGSDRVLIVIDRRSDPDPVRIRVDTADPAILWGTGTLRRDEGSLTVVPGSEVVIVGL